MRIISVEKYIKPYERKERYLKKEKIIRITGEILIMSSEKCHFYSNIMREPLYICPKHYVNIIFQYFNSFTVECDMKSFYPT